MTQITPRTNAYWLRVQRGKTASQVADGANISRATLARCEQGEEVSSPVVAKLCTYYEVTAPQLLSLDPALVADQLRGDAA